jgi:hypothetical protein
LDSLGPAYTDFLKEPFSEKNLWRSLFRSLFCGQEVVAEFGEMGGEGMAQACGPYYLPTNAFNLLMI